MKIRSHQGFTLIEYAIVVAFVAILASFYFPVSRSAHPGTGQIKQLNNAKEIAIACYLFASDHAGQYPNGKYLTSTGKISEPTPADTAEACFNDLLKSGKIVAEKVFWSPNQVTQCSPELPNENGDLWQSENCWDYIAGLSGKSKTTLPLVFEASDGGTGTRWSKAGGHPWEDVVIVCYLDGSAEKVKLTKDGQAKTKRGGTEVDLCVPTPGKDKWPDTAILSPATPTRN